MDKWICTLKEHLEQMSDDAVFYERKTLLEESFKKFRYESFSKRYAKAFAHILDHMSIVIYGEDRLIGRVQEEILSPEDDAVYNNQCLQVNFQAVRLFSYEPLEQTVFNDPDYRYAPEWFNSWGHCQPDWEKLMRVGIPGVRREAKEKLCEVGLNIEQREFLECALICTDALIRYIKRGAGIAAKMAESEKDIDIAQNLRKTSSCLFNLANAEPKSFREGLQLVWMINFILHTVCGARDYALGRMDKYLYGLYKSDIKKGEINKDQALYLIEDFCIKCNEIIGRGWEAYKPKRVLSVNSIQYVMLAGVDKDGNDVTNEISYLFLDAVEELRIKQPTLNVRWHEGIDEKFFEKASQIAALGLGYPSFYNDHTVFSALESCGIDYEDRVDYGFYGCNNSILMGKEDELREAWHNVPLYLELAMNEGRRFGSDQVIGVKTPHVSGFVTMNDLVEALREQIKYGIACAKEKTERGDRKWNELKPFAFESVLMSHCIERISGFNQDGSKYKHMNNHFVGFATVTNSLYSINKLVFQEKRLSLTELVDILVNDWKKSPKLQFEVKNTYAKYGNDDDEVDNIGVRIAEIFVDEVKKASPTKNGRTLYPSIYSLFHQRALGKSVSASADGRSKEEPLSESQSPTYNTEVNGPTAVLNSISKLPLYKTPSGGVNVKFQPSLFKNRGGDTLLKSLIAGFFRQGGMHIQINVVDRVVLEDAKLHPNKHKNLLVRVVGYSAYFVTLSPEQQDEIIERTALK
jgi:formate C-acetyltransferase